MIMVMTTVGSEQQAIDIADTLVQNKLAACVSYSLRFHSVYWWEDKVCRDQEVLLLIKGSKKNEKEIMEVILTIHNYDVPEIISFPVSSASKEYLDWIDSVTK